MKEKPQSSDPQKRIGKSPEFQSSQWFSYTLGLSLIIGLKPLSASGAAFSAPQLIALIPFFVSCIRDTSRCMKVQQSLTYPTQRSNISLMPGTSLRSAVSIAQPMATEHFSKPATNSARDTVPVITSQYNDTGLLRTRSLDSSEGRIRHVSPQAPELYHHRPSIPTHRAASSGVAAIDTLYCSCCGTTTLQKSIDRNCRTCHGFADDVRKRQWSDNCIPDIGTEIEKEGGTACANVLNFRLSMLHDLKSHMGPEALGQRSNLMVED